MNNTDTIKLKIEVRDDGSIVVTNLQEKIKKSTEAVGVFEKSSKSLHNNLGTLWKQFTIGNLAADAFRSALQSVKRVIHDVIQSVSDFEKEFANVTTLLTNETMPGAHLMREELLSMAGDLGSTIELTKGLYQTLSSGVEPGIEAMKFLEAAAKFAKAGLVDMTSSVDVLSTVINAYGLKTEEVTEVSDILFQTIKDGKITGQELASSFGDVINSAAQMGVNIREVSAAITIMTKTGIKSSEATTALNQALMGVLGASPEVIQRAKEMGIEFSRMGIEAAGGLQKWLMKVSDAVGDNKEKLKELFPNIQGLKSVMALAGEQAEEYAKQMERMNDVSGNVEEAFEKQIATFDSAKKAISNMAEAAFQEALLPSLQQLARWIRENKEGIVTFFKTLAFVIKGVVGTVAMLIDGLNKLPTLGGMSAINKIMEAQMYEQAKAILKQREEQQKEWEEFLGTGFGVTKLLDLLGKGYKEAEKFMKDYTRSVVDGVKYTEDEAEVMRNLENKIKNLKHEVYGYTEFSDQAQEKIKELNEEIKRLIKLKSEVAAAPEKYFDTIVDSSQLSTYTKTMSNSFETLRFNIAEATLAQEMWAQKTDQASRSGLGFNQIIFRMAENVIDTKNEMTALQESVNKTIGDVLKIGNAFLDLGVALGMDTSMAGQLSKTLSDAAGVASGVMQGLTTGDWTQAIASGISLIADLFGLFGGTDPVEEALEDWNALIEDGKEGTNEMWELLQQIKRENLEIAEIQEYQKEKILEVKNVLGDYYEYAAASQKLFDRALIYTLATFSGLIASGYTFIEAIREMKNEFQKLLDIIAETGYVADESFQFLLNIADFLEQNQVFADALSAVSSMTDNIFRSGALSLDQLQAVIFTAGADLTDMYHQALAMGATKEEAYAMIADSMSDIIFWANEYGFKIDDQTAALIAEMQAAGYLTELQIPEDVKQTMLQEEMVKIMGGTIPYLLDRIETNTAQWLQEAKSDPDTIYDHNIDINKYGSGGDFWVDRATPIIVGEGGEPEHVVITPKSKYHGPVNTGGGVRIGSQSISLIIDNLVMQPGENANDLILQAKQRLANNDYALKDDIQDIAIQAVESRLERD